jgi:hypothetical protein
MPSGILPAKLHTPGFSRSAFGRGNVSLKLDRVGACISNGVDKGMGHSQTAIVRLRNFTDDQTASVGRFAGDV